MREGILFAAGVVEMASQLARRRISGDIRQQVGPGFRREALMNLQRPLGRPIRRALVGQTLFTERFGDGQTVERGRVLGQKRSPPGEIEARRGLHRPPG